jgi:hypothetical protein
VLACRVVGESISTRRPTDSLPPRTSPGQSLLCAANSSLGADAYSRRPCPRRRDDARAASVFVDELVKAARYRLDLLERGLINGGVAKCRCAPLDIKLLLWSTQWLLEECGVEFGRRC